MGDFCALLTSLSSVNHIYRTAKGWRIFIYLGGPLLTMLFGWGGWKVLTSSSPTNTIVLACIALLVWGFGLFLVYAIVETAKWHLQLSDEEIQAVGWLKTKRLAWDQVAGYRFTEQYIFIVPKRKELPTIKIGYTTQGYSDMQAFLAEHFDDLDVVQAAQEEEKLVNDLAAGPTPEVVERELAVARRTAGWMNGFGLVVAVWLFFYPHPYNYACWAALAVPALAVGLQVRHPRFIRLNELKGSAYPSLFAALLMPPLILLLRGVLDFELVSYAAFWQPFVLVALGSAVVLSFSDRYFLFRRATAGSEALAAGFIALVFGFGSTYMANVLFDTTTPQHYQATVLKKHTSSGKTTTYHLTVTPWGPRPENDDVSVTSDYYKQIQPGDSVTIRVSPGFLHVPWFTVEE